MEPTKEPENRVLDSFADAMEIADAKAREDYLSKACGADQALRNEVEELLRAQAQAGRFLPDQPKGRPGLTGRTLVRKQKID